MHKLHCIRRFSTIGTRRMGPVTRKPLLESSTASEPSEQLHNWLEEAKNAGLPLPTVSSLATAALPSGRVSNRMIVVKDVTQDGRLVVYSDWEKSHKGSDVKSNPNVALTFYWRELDRSLRVEGQIKRMSQEESLPYFKSRPHEFQASVSIDNQTQVVANRGVVESKLRKLDETENLNIPEWWGGAVITPDYYEFWQGREDRVHDRIEFLLQDNRWVRNRLTP